jgi:uncharacterized damage-inducible protein DinB
VSAKVSVTLQELMDFTEWERGKWHQWLLERGDAVLAIGAGPHGDGRFESVGDLVKHIFIAEKHHVDRLSHRSITDTAAIAGNNIESLFAFGRRSRHDLKTFVESLPAKDWDIPREFRIMDKPLSVTPRKFILHILMHEIRHWAQIATILRLNGLPGGFADFLFSPLMAGGAKS